MHKYTEPQNSASGHAHKSYLWRAMASRCNGCLALTNTRNLHVTKPGSWRNFCNILVPSRCSVAVILAASDTDTNQHYPVRLCSCTSISHAVAADQLYYLGVQPGQCPHLFEYHVVHFSFQHCKKYPQVYGRHLQLENTHSRV